MNPPNSSSRSYARALAVAERAARQAGSLLASELHRPGGPRGSGGHAPIDEEAEALIRALLLAEFPEYGVLGEELSDRDCPPKDEGRHLWVIDPNDGTVSFLEGERGSAVSIALLRNGEPILGVVFAFAAPDDDGDFFAWAEGCGPLTRNGSPIGPERSWPTTLEGEHTLLVSQHADRNSEANARVVAPARFRAVPSIAWRLALVAAGEGVCAVSLNGPKAWDLAAGHALLRAVAGDLFDARGEPLRYSPEGVCPSSDCFGGGAAVARALLGRDRRSVFARPAVAPEEYPLVLPAPGRLFRDAGVLSRAQGCLLGQVAGDSLGSLVEFRGADWIRGRHPDGVRLLADGGTWDTLAGQPTDDSELALLLARALVGAGRFEEEAVARAYAWWYQSAPFDIGGTTRQALSAAAQARTGERTGVAAAARSAASRSSQANGALMRVSPLGIFGYSAAPESLAAWARADASLSHPHPICQDASALFAVTLARAIATGRKPAELHAEAVAWARTAGLHADVVAAVVDAASGPPSDYQSQMGWVLIALRNAFYQLLSAPTLEAGVVDTVMRGGDTDTNAAIAGALLGAAHGRTAVPAQWRDRVLTCRPIAGLEAVHRPRPRPLWPVDALSLAERLLVLGR
ncbi:MAG: ADP-ribosylglycohydrolase family protein [Planctomycetes bacterium]|nr:ADP-ribosylglycohydrolase family protein [Planctomycetota bacterium]